MSSARSAASRSGSLAGIGTDDASRVAVSVDGLWEIEVGPPASNSVGADVKLSPTKVLGELDQCPFLPQRWASTALRIGMGGMDGLEHPCGSGPLMSRALRPSACGAGLHCACEPHTKLGHAGLAAHVCRGEGGRRSASLCAIESSRASLGIIQLRVSSHAWSRFRPCRAQLGTIDRRRKVSNCRS